MLSHCGADHEERVPEEDHDQVPEEERDEAAPSLREEEGQRGGCDGEREDGQGECDPAVDLDRGGHRLAAAPDETPQTIDGVKQCLVKSDDPTTWKPCDDKWQGAHRVWWDVFPIPRGKTVNNIVIPGYFKMRSRFVDYAGQYVMHCHILAHEDRGMMTIVQVAPFRTPYSHQ